MVHYWFSWVIYLVQWVLMLHLPVYYGFWEPRDETLPSEKYLAESDWRR